MVVPTGRGATGEDGEAGPDPVVGEGLASLHAAALLGRWVLQLLFGDDLWAIHRLLPARWVPQQRAPVSLAPQYSKASHDRGIAAPEHG